MNARRYASLTAIASALFLTGCASVAPDGLRSDVQQQTQNSLPTGAQLSSFDKEQKEAARTQVADWLKAPVDADTAVRIALLNSPALQAQLADLAAQDAQRAQAEKESAAITGFTSAIAAYGAFFIPKSFGLSINATGGAGAALWGFLGFYVSCLVITWVFYARPGGMLHAAERGLTLQPAE